MDKRGVITFLDYKVNSIEFKNNDDPYVRALVSSFTANANVTPLILPTVNINKLLDKGEQV